MFGRFSQTPTLHPGPTGQARVSTPREVVVVGGGLAGIAAATILAERGVSVTVLEREPVLGGRVSAWTDELSTGETFEMERGFHAFFRQYYNLRRLLKRIDPDLRNLIPCEDYPLLGPGGFAESFKDLPVRAPFNIMELVRRTPTLGLLDLLKVNPAPAFAMMKYHPEETFEAYDGLNAGEFLDSLNFPKKAREMLFSVFSHSFFNPERGMSAAELLMMFHFYFIGNPEGLVFDVLNEPFSDALWHPFRRYLEELGVTFQLETEVSRIEPLEAGRWRVHTSEEASFDGDGVVLAVTLPALQHIVDESSPAIGSPSWREDLSSLELTLPFAVWRLWLDRPTRPGREPFIGTTGFGLLDNISLYHLFEGESRRWAMRTGGSIVELHAYAVPEDMDADAIKADLLPHLYTLYPETREANILEERFLLRQDCPAFAPGAFKKRPTVKTPSTGIVLAGDAIRIPIPSALMERATASGFMAANALLELWGVRGEDILSVPMKGMLAR